jgi:hypothetical protein
MLMHQQPLPSETSRFCASRRSLFEGVSMRFFRKRRMPEPPRIPAEQPAVSARSLSTEERVAIAHAVICVDALARERRLIDQR